MALFVYDYKTILGRFDEDGIMPYYRGDDFAGLQSRPIAFCNESALLLRGNVYFYPNARKDSLVVLCHGYGGGHRSYLREIEVLCRAGYQVLAYDATGCFSSEGEGMGCFAQGVADLQACLCYVRAQKEYAETRIILFGHSWGAYCGAQMLGLRSDIEKAILISGFIGVKEWALADTGNEEIANIAERYEKSKLPHYANLSVPSAIINTKAAVTVIHSEEDPVVPIQAGILPFAEQLKRDNIICIRVNEKAHCPTYTREAVCYLSKTLSEYQNRVSAGTLNTFEQKQAYMQTKSIDKMTQQDDAVWNRILAILKDS